jgi:excisionase family DNA binding protein
VEPLVLEAREAAQRARFGVRIIYRALQAGRLRAVRVGGRRETASAARLGRRLVVVGGIV